MNAITKLDGLEVGYDVPALPGMDEKDIQTPCLVLDLDALAVGRVVAGQDASSDPGGVGARVGVRWRVDRSADGDGSSADRPVIDRHRGRIVGRYQLRFWWWCK